MTVIAAAHRGGETIIGCDSQITNGEHRHLEANGAVSKILRLGPNCIGLSSWAVYMHVLEFMTGRDKVPLLKDEEAVFRFFLKVWRQAKEEFHFINDQCDSSRESPFLDLDATFLVANAAGIFTVTPELHVTRQRQYMAIGSGSLFAMGALHALWPTRATARALVKSALEAGMAFDRGCGGRPQFFRASGSS